MACICCGSTSSAGSAVGYGEGGSGTKLVEEIPSSDGYRERCFAAEERLRRFLVDSLRESWLTQHLKRVNRGFNVRRCSFSLLGEGQGIMGTIFKVNIQWDSGGETSQEKKDAVGGGSMKRGGRGRRAPPKSVALKAVFADNQYFIDVLTEEEITTILRQIHNCECAFYRLFLDENDNANDEVSPLNSLPRRPPMPMAECYAAEFWTDESPGCLLLEDLSAYAAAKPPTQGLGLEATLNVIECIASLHAFSLRDRRWLVDPHLQTNFADFVRAAEESLVGSMENAKDILLSLYPAHFDPIAHRITDIYESMDFINEVANMHQLLGTPPVLCHGDLWSNNIMFALNQLPYDCQQTSSSTSSRVAAILDWQTAHPGCMAEDIVRLVTSSVSARTRRDNTDVILRHYYRCLSERLAAPPLSAAQSPPFDMATLREAYDRLFSYGVLSSVTAIASWLWIEAQQPTGVDGVAVAEVAWHLFGADPLLRQRRRAELIQRCLALLQDCPQPPCSAT